MRFLCVGGLAAVLLVFVMGKRRKLKDSADAETLGSLPLASSVLAKAIAKIREVGPSEATMDSMTSRQQIDRDRRKAFGLCGDPVQVDLPLVEEMPKYPGVHVFPWYICDVARYMQRSVDVFPGYRALLTDTFRRSPCTPDSPWNSILSFDEFVPGMVLNTDNLRKAWTWMIAIKEFGAPMLQHLGAWVPVGVLRSSVVKIVEGGLSRVGVELAERFRNLHVEGFVLNLDSGPTWIFLRFNGPLADGSGLQYFYSAKGAAGTCPCLLCSNVIGMEDTVEDSLCPHSESIVNISMNDTRQFLMVSMEQRFVQADTLIAVRDRLTQEAFAETEQSFGINCNPHGIYFANHVRDLLASTSPRYDPMHCVFQHGIAETELCFLLSDLKLLGITMDQINTICCADWKVPLEKGKLLTNLFTTKRRKQFDRSESFQISASEMVTAIPIVLYFLEIVPLIRERLPLQLASWRALERLCRQLLRAKLGLGSSQELAESIKVHGEQYTLAYGGRPYAFQPKFHWTKHLPWQFGQDEFLIDMFVTERANILYRSSADPLCNTRGKVPSRWETTCIENVWKAHRDYIRLLKRDGFDNGIDLPELGEGAKLALTCVSRGIELKDGNIVFLGEGRPFLLAAFASLPTVFFYVGHHCREVERRTSNTAYYEPDVELDFVKLPDLVRVAPMYAVEAGGFLIFDA